MNEAQEEVVACVWPDGHAIWSESRRRSGSPFFTGQVDPVKLKAFLKTLRASGLYTRKQWGIVMTDGPMIVATILDGPRRVELGTFPGAYVVRGKAAPERVTDDSSAAMFLRHEIESLLPRPGRRRYWFLYRLRDLEQT